MWPFNKPCRHWDTSSVFYDLHRGADGELYVRHTVECRICEWKRTFAVRLPNAVTEAIDLHIYAGTLERKVSNV